MLKNILAAAVVLYPDGNSLRSLINRLVFLFHCLTNRKHIDHFVKNCKYPFDSIELDEDILGVVIWPYIHCRWNVEKRLSTISNHYLFIEQHARELLVVTRLESLMLADLSEFSADLRIVLDRPKWFKREGELVLNLFKADIRVASIAFIFQVLGNERLIVIGALQGIHKGIPSEKSLLIYKEITKDLAGYRPKFFVLNALKEIAATYQITKILAISDSCRHHRHPYFGSQKVGTHLSNYDEIWLEDGGIADSASGFFELPLANVRKDIKEIESKKRSQYRKRYQILDYVKRTSNLNLLQSPT